MSIEVSVAGSADAELVAAFANLVPQLSSSAPAPGRDVLAEIVGAACNTVLVARDPGETIWPWRHRALFRHKDSR